MGLFSEIKTNSQSYEQARVARDVLGTRIGVGFWLAGIAVIVYLLYNLNSGITGNTWIEYQGLNTQKPPSFFANILNNFLATAIWLCGSALPFILILLSFYSLRRAWQYWHHNYDSASRDNFIQTITGLCLLVLFLCSFANSNYLPFSYFVRYQLSGGIIGAEVSSTLLYFTNNLITYLINIIGITLGLTLFFRLSLFSIIEYLGTAIDVIWEFYIRKKDESTDRSLGTLARKMREETVTIQKQNNNQSIKIVRPTRPTRQIDLFESANSPVALNKTSNSSNNNPKTNIANQSLLKNQTRSLTRAISNKITPAHPVKIVVPEKPITPVINKSSVRIITNNVSPNINSANNYSNGDRTPPPSPTSPSENNFNQNSEINNAKTILISDIKVYENLAEKSIKNEVQPKVTIPQEPKTINNIDELFQNRQFEKTQYINVADLPTALANAKNNIPPINYIAPIDPEPQKFTPVTPIVDGDKILDDYLPPINSAENQLAPNPEDTEESEDTEDLIETADDTPKHHLASPSINYEQWNKFNLPPLSLLDDSENDVELPNNEVIQFTSKQIENSLKSFGVTVQVAEAYPGPVITSYHIELAQGVKGSTIVNLAKDLARSIAVNSIRVVESIPNTNYMGLEVPNKNRQMVKLSEILTSEEYHSVTSPLTLAIGKDIGGVPVTLNLGKMPHLLVCGTTGSGKSVGVNDMILSMLYKATPNEIRFVMIDPKMVELSVYDDIPHLLSPVITDMKQAVGALTWCVQEMERRQELLASIKVRNLNDYNKNVIKAREARTPLRDTVAEKNALENGEINPQYYLTTMPFLVVIVDEFADLIMVIVKKVEELIARLAQKGRACGIHIILATQRPSADVVTGLIKANIPSRIAFQVSSKNDSRVIFEQNGAESLLGHGDMLFYQNGRISRMHAAFVSDDEVNNIAEYLRNESPPKYLFTAFEEPAEPGDNSKNLAADNADEYDLAVASVIESRNASISYLQRRLSIGFNKAAKLIERMEAEGVVSIPGKNGKREVMVGGR